LKVANPENGLRKDVRTVQYFGGSCSVVLTSLNLLANKTASTNIQVDGVILIVTENY
jgi:hypothetical protein